MSNSLKKVIFVILKDFSLNSSDFKELLSRPIADDSKTASLWQTSQEEDKGLLCIGDPFAVHRTTSVENKDKVKSGWVYLDRLFRFLIFEDH